MLDEYVRKLERDMVQGVVQLLLLVHVERRQPIHGYALIKELGTAFRGRFDFKEGTVYPLLARLEKGGFVRSSWGKGVDGPRRKYYELTADGRRAAVLAGSQWHAFRQAVDGVVDTKEVPGE